MSGSISVSRGLVEKQNINLNAPLDISAFTRNQWCGCVGVMQHKIYMFAAAAVAR